MQAKYQKFLETEFTVFDIETTGLNPASDDILEIAAIRLRGKQEIARYEALVQPLRSIPPESEKIHGLNEFYLLVNGRKIDQVLHDYLEFIGNSIVVGHNIREFDWLFIQNQLKKMELPILENKLIDTLELARKLLKLPSHTLTNVAKHYGLEHKNAHRAMPDVEINTQVFLHLMEQILSTEAITNQSSNL